MNVASPLKTMGRRLCARLEAHPLRWLLAATLAYYLTYFNYGIDLDDEGFLLANAASILDGRWPMADFFSYQPFSYFLLAGAFKVLGDTVLTERIVLAALILANVALLYYCARRVLDWRWALLAAAVYAAAPGPWYKVFFISHMLLCCAAALWYLERPVLARAFVAGIAVGIALVSRVEAGLIALSLCAACVLAAPVAGLAVGQSGFARRAGSGAGHLAVLLAGVGLPVAATLGAYALAGKLGDMGAMVSHYYNYSRAVNYVNAYAGIETKFSVTKLSYRGPAEMWAWGFAFIACVGVSAIGAVRLFGRPEHRRSAALMLTLGGFGLGTMAYTYYYVWNSRILSSFAIVYACYFLFLVTVARKVSESSRARGMALLAVGVLVVGICLVKFCKVQNYSGSITTRMSEMATVDHPKLAGLRVYAEQKVAIDDMLRIIAGAKPGDALIPMSEATTMGYLSGLPNPTYYRLFTSEFAPPGEHERAIETFERLRIRYFVARRSQFLPGGGPGSNLEAYAPKIRAWLIENFTVTPLGKSFVLLERKGAE